MQRLTFKRRSIIDGLTLIVPGNGMARPLSEEKRIALLTAATAAVASSGISASTYRIAKDAGVAEGTLFRYFPTKDALYERLYLDLKEDLVTYLVDGLPDEAGSERKFRHLWDRFVEWGLRAPEKQKALRQLEAFHAISDTDPRLDNAMARSLQEVVQQGFKSGVLKKQPVMFLWGLIQGIAGVVFENASRDSKEVERCKTLGWEALWGAVAKPRR
ncbi:MAG: TetR/AcrR family transcriptional regulator [Verrucomicrobiaceae bacterium]|nr:MAG: TetR/AcrR family transcriptional regulator [Verrucomicrobiaceae bacterium]